jgi:hypothetical protein
MDLFKSSGNIDIEGVDEKNACFGGTQALLHSVDWIYSNYQFEGFHFFYKINFQILFRTFSNCCLR